MDVTNKRSLWENKGASPTKVDYLFQTIHECHNEEMISVLLSTIWENLNEHPDEVLTMPILLVLLKHATL